MKFSKGTLSIAIAIVAVVSINLVQASYYDRAKANMTHAYDKTTDKAQELYDKATGRAVEGPRVQMENGKMKTSLITTDKAGQYVTKKTMPYYGEYGTPVTGQPTTDMNYDQQMIENE